MMNVMLALKFNKLWVVVKRRGNFGLLFCSKMWVNQEIILTKESFADKFKVTVSIIFK